MLTMSGEIRNSIEELTNLEVGEQEDFEESQLQQKKTLFTCDLCNIQVTSNNVLRKHKEGRKHLMRVERQGKTFECELCQVVANSQSQLDAHLRSSKHKACLIKKENANQMMNKGVWIIIFGVICIFINLLLLIKYMNRIL